MRTSMIIRLLAALLELITPEMIRVAMTAMCDGLIKWIENSPNTVDDAVLPLIRKIRDIVAE